MKWHWVFEELHGFLLLEHSIADKEGWDRLERNAVARWWEVSHAIIKGT